MNFAGQRTQMLLQEMGEDMGGMGFGGHYGNEEDYMAR